MPPKIRKMYGGSKSELKSFMVGTLRSYKGHFRLLRSLVTVP